MVITVIRVATPMVRPMVVKTARSLCWRSASMLWLRLSARFSISGYLNAFPFLANAENVYAGGQVDSQAVMLLAIDLDRAGFDLAFGVGTRIGQACRHENLRQTGSGIGRHGDSFDISRFLASAYFAIEIRLGLRGCFGRVEVGDDLPR